jgi:hypothetical protein
MKAKSLLSILLLAAVGLGLSATNVAAHPDEECDAVRLAMVTFAHATAICDVETAAEVLHDDLTTNWGVTKESILARVAKSEPGWIRIVLRYAVFKKVDERVRVTPVVIYIGRERYVQTIELVKTGGRWQIVSLAEDAELPLELQQEDKKSPLPEHFMLYPVAVHLRDATTTKPIFARVHVTDSDGEYWPPEGHMKNILTGWNPDVGGDTKLGGKTYAYVGADFTLPLPVGSYDIEVVRGIEYEPRTIHFEVSKSQVPTLVVKLQRWSNIAQEGWFSGDTHVHFLDPRTGILEMKGEDLNVLNILATKWAELITNVEHFTGAPSPLSEPGHILYVNEESRHGFLGHTILLNLKKLVYPLAWGPAGGEGVHGGHDYPTMASQADRTHEQGGLVTWAHFPGPWGELAVDIALGKVDSVDLMTWGDAFAEDGKMPGAARTWYRFLNLSFRVPATAGTDKMQNSQIVGSVRTYVKVDGPLSYQGWINGIRAGRTFVTTGPILKFSAEGAELGETIKAETGQVLSAHVELSSRIPVERIEIIRGGEVIASKENPAGANSVSFSTQIPIEASTWIAARASSSVRLPYQDGIPVFAHTSPIYVEVPGRPIGSPEDAAFFTKWCEDAIEWAKTKAKLLEESQRQEMIALFEKARKIYLDKASGTN